MAPHITHLTQADYQISQWSGGTTTQIAIAPPVSYTHLTLPTILRV